MKQIKKNNKKLHRLYSAVLSVIITGCSSGGSSNNGNSNTGNLSSLEFSSPYELASFESYPGKGYVVVTNNDESRTINNISYHLNSILGGGANVSIDTNSAESCAVLTPQNNCILKLDLDAAARGGSFIIGAKIGSGTTNKIKQFFSTSDSSVSAKAPIGVKQVIVSNESGVDGVKLFYYPEVGSHYDYVLMVAVVTSDKVGVFNNIVLLDKNNQPLPGQRVISGNSGPGAAPLKLGDSVSIILPVSFIIEKPEGFKLKLFDLTADGLEQFVQISSQLNSIKVTRNAVLYNYPSSIILSPDNSEQNVAIANIGDSDASGYSISSSNPSLATVTTQATMSQRNVKPNNQLLADTPAGYTVSLTNPLNPVNEAFSINQSYFNGESIVYLLTLATSSSASWPQPTPTTSPSPSPSPSPVNCVWREVGNASSFFGQLSKGPGNISAPMLLSHGGGKLYVGGYINYENGEHLGVAEIDTASGTSWTSVADSELLFADTFNLNQLSSLAINNDGSKLYLGGQYYDGERPVVYLSSNDGSWQKVQNIYSNMGFNPRFFTISSLFLDGNTLYASGYYNGNSFVAGSYQDGEWSGVSNSPDAFNGKSIYSLLYSNGILYAGGESSMTSGSSLYQYSGSGVWQEISPQLSNTGAITTLAASDLAIYAGGVLSDYSGAIVLSLTFGSGQWLNISSQIGSGWINSLQLNGDKLYAGGYVESKVITTSTNSGVNWTAVWDANSELDGPVANIVVSSDGTIYADGEFSQKVAKLVCE